MFVLNSYFLWFADPIFDPKVANCDFERGFCQYTQSAVDGQMWKRVSVQKNIYRTGDHTTGTGTVMSFSKYEFDDDAPVHLRMCSRIYTTYVWYIQSCAEKTYKQVTAGQKLVSVSFKTVILQ